ERIWSMSEAAKEAYNKILEVEGEDSDAVPAAVYKNFKDEIDLIGLTLERSRDTNYVAFSDIQKILETVLQDNSIKTEQVRKLKSELLEHYNTIKKEAKGCADVDNDSTIYNFYKTLHSLSL